MHTYPHRGVSTDFGFEIVRCTQSVAVVFDQPEIVFAAECGNDIQIEGIAQGVGQKNRPGPIAQGSIELRCIHVIGRDNDIHENGNQPVLQNGVDRCGKTHRQGNDLIAGFQAAIFQDR